MNSPYLKPSLQAIKAAEAVILKHFDHLPPVQEKADHSPVTQADQEAERAIKKVIHAAFPDHGFLGEEYGEEGSSDYTWIIDPIDGTKNFIRKLPFFSTEIALMYQNQVIFGISNCPKLKKLLYAQKGEGSFTESGIKNHVSAVTQLKQAYVTLGSITHFDTMHKTKGLHTLSNTAHTRCFGDSWSFHFVAQGNIDAVIEPKVKLWDFAAGVIIIEEAGGTVTDIQGKPITKASTTFIASNGHLHPQLLQIFNPD
jgi:histidinol-phosphatase